MRDFKFRAWDEQNKIMHNNFQFIQSGAEGNDWVVFTSDLQKLDDEHHPFKNPYFQQQMKKMQATGLADKNGVDIYEGDLLEQHKQGVCEVKYGNNHFDYAGFTLTNQQGMVNTLQSPQIYKVIGNIHENPEML